MLQWDNSISSDFGPALPALYGIAPFLARPVSYITLCVSTDLPKDLDGKYVDLCNIPAMLFYEVGESQRE